MLSKHNLVLLVITLISATLGVFFWGFWKLSNNTDQLNLSPVVLMLGVLFLSSIALLSFLNDSAFASLPIFISCGLPVFVYEVNKYTLISFIIMVLAGSLLNIRAKVFKYSLIKPSIPITLSGLSMTVTLISLALSLTYFPQAQTISQNFKLEIPDQIFSKIYENLTQQFTQSSTAGDDKAAANAEEYFDSQIPQIRSQLMAQGITEEGQIQGQINKSREQYLKQVKESFTGQNSTESTQNSDLIKSSVENQLNSVIDANRDVIPYILAVSLFFSVTFFSSIFTFLILGLVQFYVFLLLKTGIVKITTQSIEARRISF